jgi:hypothetical protein
VIGKEGSKYIVSDCYHPERTELDRESLRKGIKRADDNLSEISKRMMEIGDRWCDISLFAARIGKKRGLGEDRLRELDSVDALEVVSQPQLYLFKSFFKFCGSENI